MAGLRTIGHERSEETARDLLANCIHDAVHEQVVIVLAHELAYVAQSQVTNEMKANAGINMLGQLALQAVIALAVVKPSYPLCGLVPRSRYPTYTLSASNCDCLKSPTTPRAHARRHFEQPNALTRITELGGEYPVARTQGVRSGGAVSARWEGVRCVGDLTPLSAPRSKLAPLSVG